MFIYIGKDEDTKEESGMENKIERLTIKRIMIYIIGILFVSLGIVLCKKCGMGISPISSIPFVLSYVTPLTFGNWTTLFHFTNTILQMLLAKRWLDIKLWLQIPLAFCFGWAIDGFNYLIVIDNRVLFYQIIALILSVFFTALGMVCMLEMNLIQNPPDGTVKQISIMIKKDIGTVKIGYDVICVLVSIFVSLVFLHKIEGFGLATIVSAIFVGKTVNWIKNMLLHIKSRRRMIIR